LKPVPIGQLAQHHLSPARSKVPIVPVVPNERDWQERQNFASLCEFEPTWPIRLPMNLLALRAVKSRRFKPFRHNIEILKPVPIVPNVQSLRSVQVVKTNQDWQDRFNSVLCVMKKNSDISPRRR
jgi:hypothetical protein